MASGPNIILILKNIQLQTDNKEMQKNNAAEIWWEEEGWESTKLIDEPSSWALRFYFLKYKRAFPLFIESSNS